MAIKDISDTKLKEEEVFSEVKQHIDVGFDETDKRATGRNRIGSISFNEADELFRSWLDENTWPYDALLFDPRTFTLIFEKTSRLISNKPKGHLVARQGASMLSAKINNALLSYQWDNANHGGTMLSKWALMDINTRKYGASFALVNWRYEKDQKGRVVFDGPEMKVLRNRDIAHDLTATSIEDCNWFQVREYPTLQSLKLINDASRSGPIYKNLKELEFSLALRDNKVSSRLNSGGDGRDWNYVSRDREIAGLETNPFGKDPSFKTVEIVTEYRKDRWITVAPKHGLVLRDIPNPYLNNEIPIVMLKYYVIDDDLYGLSEIEPIKGLQKAVNAILCQYVDEINQKLYSPIAVGPGVRQHTLEWGKGARWMMNNPMTDFRLVESKSNAAQYFQSTYSALISAMMNAIGESSLGTSNTQPFQTEKTATEIKALQIQRNARDNYNQIYLSEAIKRQYRLWHTMNQVLLFSDPKSSYHIIRVSGPDALNYLQERGLAEMDLNEDGILNLTKENQQLADKVAQAQAFGSGVFKDLLKSPTIKGILRSDELSKVQTPRYPVITEDGVVPKLQMEPGSRGGGVLYVEPSDIDGTYDFEVDVQSMQIGAEDERRQGRQTALTAITTNENILQLLANEGYSPKFKELFVSWLEDLGFLDAERFFEKQQAAGVDPRQLLAQFTGGAQQNAGAQGGIPGGTNPNMGGASMQESPFINRDQAQPLGPVSPKALAAISNG